MYNPNLLGKIGMVFFVFFFMICTLCPNCTLYIVDQCLLAID
uniref:Uncharacterized protein n=1 Tax=Rhizophora mucronata TaxID=61149 RepID=A0A2P2Q4X4_RHIMU